MTYPNSAIAHASHSLTTIARHTPKSSQIDIAPAAQPLDWKTHVVDSYRHAQRQALTVLPELLAARVSALTGRSIHPEDVFVDTDAELAVVVVDGVVFRAHNQQVVVLRSCVECGIQRFESPALFSRADLGYALSAWQPYCRNCQPEDPADIE
ncbi:MAG TPA: hypothetical protein VKE41_09125 [Roseiflexaceae bacterium]|nr:hypothetical protein [Roseiflexaceae bacterium]